MSQLLGCWASSGYGIEGCGKLEEALRSCMDNQVQTPLRANCGTNEVADRVFFSLQKKVQQSKSTINYHLSRFYQNLIGPHKRNR
jgi:hypothetical protein